MVMELPSSSWIKVNPCLMLTMQTYSFRRSYTWWETHNYASATLMQSLQNMKNVSMMVQKSLQHMMATLKGWFRDLRWLMISKQAQRSQSSKEHSQKIIKEQSETTMKNQWLRATRSKGMLKTKSFRVQMATPPMFKVTSLRGRLLGIHIIPAKDSVT